MAKNSIISLCNEVDLNDGPYLTFGNESGKKFVLLISEIKEMVQTLISEYDKIISEIQTHPQYIKKDYIWVYQEKPFRSIRTYFPIDKFPTINPLIGSQTKGIFNAINAFVCFLLGIKINDDILMFEREILIKALMKFEIYENGNLLSKEESNLGSKYLSGPFKSVKDAAYNSILYCYKNNLSDFLVSLEFSGETVKVKNAHIYYWTTKEAKENGKTDPRTFSGPFIFNGREHFLSDQWTKDHPNGRSISELNECLLNILGYELINQNDSYYFCKLNQCIDFLGIPLPKPFLLLAGISGTGKTRFVREQAKMAAGQFGIDPKINYCCVPVRPDWHEPSDLLGYVSRIGGKAQYVPTQFLHFILDAWKHATDDNGELLAFGNQIPFWLCLDEMNLAPVEQYFADFLSALESRKWENGKYSCEPLLNITVFEQVDHADVKAVLQLAGNTRGEKLWEMFIEGGISIPPNLIVAGTVNMDETTHGFSRKVIDRALTFDFGEFFPNSFNGYFKPEITERQLSIFNETQISGGNRELLLEVAADTDGEKSIAFLNEINNILIGTPFELAYRALNELLLTLVCIKPKDDNGLYALWDDYLMMKVLPRIDGDNDKLRFLKQVNNIKSEILKELDLTRDDSNLLVYIYDYLSEKLETIWGDDKSRPDLFRNDISDSSIPVQIKCRSGKKIKWMINRLKTNGFTSFWP